MNRLRRLARRLRRNEEGATIVEFGFVAMPLSIAILALFELGYTTYVQSIVQGTVDRAARLATVGNKTPNQIDAFVRDRLTTFTKGSLPEITKTNYYQFSNVGKPETLTLDANGNGRWDSGDCYQDMDNDGQWDQVAGRNGLGGSDDIVYYTVRLTYPRLFPMHGMLGWSDDNSVSATTIMRNQPYASQMVPPIRGGTSMAGTCVI